MKITLRNAALVCREWHEYVKRELYGSIVLNSRAVFNRFVAATSQCVPTRASPCSCTHTLSIRNSAYPHDFAASFPFVLGGRMAAVKTLRIHGLHHPLRSNFCLILSRMSNVTSLSLDNAVLLNFASLRRILGAFTNLTHLALSKVKILPDERVIDPSRVHNRTPAMCLRTLCLDLSLSATSLISLIDWLVHIGACKSIEVLELELPWLASPPSDVMNHVNILVEATGTSLHRLTESIAGKFRRADWLH